MVTTGVLWDPRQAELELMGRLPSELDGLLILPSVDPKRGDLLLHALRLGARRGLWFAPIAQVPARARRAGQSFTRSLGPGADGLRLQVRPQGEGSVAWSLRDAEGTAREQGSVQAERPCDVIDLLVTRRNLLVLGLSTGFACAPRYQVGIAPRQPRAHVTWLTGDQRGWPELLHASERADRVQLELSVRASAEPGAARLVSWSLDPEAGSAESRARLECPVVGPNVWVDPHGGRDFVCAVSAQRMAGESAPVLIKLDLATGDRETRSFGFARELGAPSIGEARTPGDPRRRAIILLPVYDAVRDCTECHALAADDLGAPSLAVIRLPHALRATSKTQWIASGRFCALDEALSGLTRNLG